MSAPREFAERLIDWQRRHGRHDLPWQRTDNPYRVWLSEIMLQQTQVAAVIPYYARFLERFPTLASLAAASVDEVMALWSGLGYYARARNLHRCAQILLAGHGGTFPHDPERIAALPGIGRSTANAIAVFCFGARAPILDGNVKRLLCRALGIEGFPGAAGVEKRLWQQADELLPERGVAAYIQAQMDMGATICTRARPRCQGNNGCPVADLCVALREDRVAALPTPRPGKALPERSATLLVLHADGRVLLERRPPAGIWGGLLSLPELPADAEPVAYCEQRLGLRIGAASPAPSFTHGFTHFRLEVRPLICAVLGAAQAAEPRLQWLARAELDRAALPAPIRGLLERAFSAIP